MFSPTELAAMRATVEASLPDTAQVQRRTLTPDNAGGHVETWSTLVTVPCRIAPAGRSPDERVIAERLTTTTLFTVTLPAFSDVRANDRLVVGSRTFDVLGVLASSNELSRRALCEEVA